MYNLAEPLVSTHNQRFCDHQVERGSRVSNHCSYSIHSFNSYFLFDCYTTHHHVDRNEQDQVASSKDKAVTSKKKAVTAHVYLIFVTEDHMPPGWCGCGDYESSPHSVRLVAAYKRQKSTTEHADRLRQAEDCNDSDDSEEDFFDELRSSQSMVEVVKVPFGGTNEDTFWRFDADTDHLLGPHN